MKSYIYYGRFEKKNWFHWKGEAKYYDLNKLKLNLSTSPKLNLISCTLFLEK